MNNGCVVKTQGSKLGTPAQRGANGPSLHPGAVAANTPHQAETGPTTERTLTGSYIERLDAVAKVMIAVIEQQEQFIERIHGPRVESVGKTESVQTPYGVHANIEFRLDALVSGVNKLLDNQRVINELA